MRAHEFPTKSISVALNTNKSHRIPTQDLTMNRKEQEQEQGIGLENANRKVNP